MEFSMKSYHVLMTGEEAVFPTKDLWLFLCVDSYVEENFDSRPFLIIGRIVFWAQLGPKIN